MTFFKILATILLLLPPTIIHCFQTTSTVEDEHEHERFVVAVAVVPIELQIQCTGLLSSMKELTTIEKQVVSETLEKTYVTSTGSSSSSNKSHHNHCMPISIQGMIHNDDDDNHTHEYLKVYGHRHCCLTPCDTDEEYWNLVNHQHEINIQDRTLIRADHEWEHQFMESLQKKKNSNVSSSVLQTVDDCMIYIRPRDYDITEQE